MSDGNDSQNQAEQSDWREMRRAGRDERLTARRQRWGGAPIGAIILILVGLALLADNFGYKLPANWWAFFLLIPAAGALMAALQHYREGGDRLSGDVIGSLISVAIFVGLWAAFFFGLGWGLFWPLLLMAIGIALLVRDYWPRR
jgi:hypothetical protein